MKAKRIITIVLTVLVGLMAIASGVLKLVGGEEVTTVLAKSGVADSRIFLGLMEIGFALLFLYPPTMKIGFILLACYFAGALATEISHGMPMNAIGISVLIWITAFLRDRYIFLPTPANAKVQHSI